MALLALVATQAAGLLALAATAWATGWVLGTRSGRASPGHAVGLAVGFAGLGQIAWLLAACRLLRPWGMLCAVALVHGLALPGWRALVVRGRHAWQRDAGRSRRALAALVAAVAPPFAIGLFPPTGFDEAVYHLPFVHALAHSGSLPWLPELRVPTFPVLAEAVEAPLAWLGGDGATHVVPVFASVATAALLVAWGSERAAPRAGWLAAALFLGSPLVAYLGGTGYVEAALALLVTAALYAADRAEREHSAAWAVVGGFLAGSAAAVKYLGLFAALAVPLLLLLARPRPWRTGAIAAAGASLVALAPTYLRQWLLTGNPVVPFAARLFGRGPWETASVPSPPLLARLWAELRLPADAVWHHRLVGGLPPLSPWLLAGLPLLLVAARQPRGRAAWALLLGYLALLSAQPPDARYLVPMLPLACWAIGVGGAELWARLPAPTGWFLAAALWAPAGLYAIFFIARAGAVPASPLAREAYLARVHPGYRALAALERRQGSAYTLYCVSCEWLHGFAHGRLLGEVTGPFSYAHVSPWLGDPLQLQRRLRAFGAEEVMLPAPLARQLLAVPGAEKGFREIDEDARMEVLAVAPLAGR